MFPGIVQSYDAVAQKYSIVFNDGDVFPAFRSIDVFQDMSAPLPGDRITLFAATKEDEQEELAFVARSAALLLAAAEACRGVKRKVARRLE